MEVRTSLTDKLSLGVKLIGHKLVQYRLSTNETTELETQNGRIRGLQRKTLYDAEPYYAFEGIPYAKPPLGALRFRAPEPPESWRGVRDCTYYRDKPMQQDFVLHVVQGNEDCLYLNVYAKQLKSTKPLPVMIWICGGGFQTGEATRDIYSPDYFMKKNIVLVTFSYRLGALGFLSLDDRDLEVPGNAGLKDQLAVLRWVKANIANFNGDPNNITVFGESAGAASTHVLLLSEQSRGLFHKAIMQSGSALSHWVTLPPRDWAHRLACRMGYKGSKNDKEIFRFLSRANARDIAANDICLLTQAEEHDYFIFAFSPVVEPYALEHCVIPKPILQMLPNAWGNALPLIIGGTSFEGLFSYQSHDPYLLSTFEPLLPRQLRETTSPAQLQQLVSQLKRHYLNDASRESMSLMECLHILSTKHLWHDIHRTLLARSAYATAPATFLYRFDMDSPHFNHYRILKCGKSMRGVSHADDISYMFYHVMACKLQKATPEYKTIRRLVGMWTSFAARGNPNCKQIAPTVWQPVAPAAAQHKCLNISDEVTCVELPAKEFELWDSFYSKETLY